MTSRLPWRLVKASVGRGGMALKIDAAQVATTAGVAVVIASGTLLVWSQAVLQGKTGTFFHIGFSTAASVGWPLQRLERGEYSCERCARRAAVEQHASLFPKGVVGVEETLSRATRWIWWVKTDKLFCSRRQ